MDELQKFIDFTEAHGREPNAEERRKLGIKIGIKTATITSDTIANTPSSSPHAATMALLGEIMRAKAAGERPGCVMTTIRNGVREAPQVVPTIVTNDGAIHITVDPK